jgi:hypothetical protein
VIKVASQVITPENLKKTIDEMVEKEGVKAFCLSTDKHGTALAPSKKIPLYRIPVAFAEKFFAKSNLSKAMGGMYLVPISDLSIFSDDAKDAYEKNKIS